MKKEMKKKLESVRNKVGLAGAMMLSSIAANAGTTNNTSPKNDDIDEKAVQMIKEEWQKELEKVNDKTFMIEQWEQTQKELEAIEAQKAEEEAKQAAIEAYKASKAKGL